VASISSWKAVVGGGSQGDSTSAAAGLIGGGAGAGVELGQRRGHRLNVVALPGGRRRAVSADEGAEAGDVAVNGFEIAAHVRCGWAWPRAVEAWVWRRWRRFRAAEVALRWGEPADLVGDDGETAAGLAGAGSLNRGVQSEQIGLKGDLARWR